MGGIRSFRAAGKAVDGAWGVSGRVGGGRKRGKRGQGGSRRGAKSEREKVVELLVELLVLVLVLVLPLCVLPPRMDAMPVRPQRRGGHRVVIMLWLAVASSRLIIFLVMAV